MTHFYHNTSQNTEEGGMFTYCNKIMIYSFVRLSKHCIVTILRQKGQISTGTSIVSPSLMPRCLLSEPCSADLCSKITSSYWMINVPIVYSQLTCCTLPRQLSITLICHFHTCSKLATDKGFLHTRPCQVPPVYN